MRSQISSCAQANQGDYVCIQAFVDPTAANEEKVLALASRARDATGWN